MRAVDIIVLATTTWKNFKIAEAMFELPWIFGFAAMVLYGCSIVSMMAEVDRKNLFAWFHRPRTIYLICYGYLAFVFLLAMILACVAGDYADKAAHFLTLFALSQNPLEKLGAYESFLHNQHVFTDLTLAHYVIWAAHCFIVLIAVLLSVALFIASLKKNVKQLNVNDANSHKLDLRIKTFLFKVNHCVE